MSIKYINKYLPSFSIDDDEKFDLFANKNSKYLFYKFNDQIEALGGEKQIIRHTAKMKDSVGMKKIEEKNREFLVKKVIHSIEFNNPYENSIKVPPEIIDPIENSYKISKCQVCTILSFLIFQIVLLNIFIPQVLMRFRNLIMTLKLTGGE